jgi:hypothetical protein
MSHSRGLIAPPDDDHQLDWINFFYN